MIQTESTGIPYRIWFTNGYHEGLADTTSDKGGQNAGFRPHDLLEAALASCITITAQMFAQSHGIALRQVCVTVRLNRDDPDKTVFDVKTQFEGDLSDNEIARLQSAVRACPVRKTLATAIEFSESVSESS